MSVPETRSLRFAAESPAFIVTVPVASMMPAFTPSPSILIFPPDTSPVRSTSAPEEFMSTNSEPLIEPPEARVKPFTSSVVCAPETVPDTLIALLFVFMPRIVSAITDPVIFRAPESMFTEFPSTRPVISKSFPPVFRVTRPSPITSPPSSIPSASILMSFPDTEPSMFASPVESMSTLPPRTLPVIFVVPEEFIATDVVPVMLFAFTPAPSTLTSVPDTSPFRSTSPCCEFMSTVPRETTAAP